MKRLFLFSILITLLLILLSPVGFGQGSEEWSRPLRLGDGWFPDVAADSSGRVHLVYASAIGGLESFDGYDIVMYTSSPDGVRWTPPNDIGARPQVGGSEATRPYLISDSQNNLHLTFRDITVFYAQTHASLAEKASNWFQKPIHQGYFSVIAIDNQERYHLVFTENVITDQCPICYHVYHTYSDNRGESWSTPLDVSTLPTGSAKPRLVVDSQDRLYLIWEAGVGGSYGQLIDPTTVLFALSTDQGQTWSLPVQLSPQHERARQPGLGIDGEERLVAVWLDPETDIVYYRVSPDRGRTWTPATPIANTYGGWSIFPARLDHYVMEQDGQGNLHLVLVGRTSREQQFLDLLHLTWNGASWSAPDVIASFYGDVPEWPEITIANGNQLHVAWFIRPEAYIWSGGFASQIWYAQRTLDVPGSPAIPVATVTPLPSPTPEPTFAVPTAEALAPEVVQASELGFMGDITTENDEVFLILQSVIPSLLLIGLAATVVRRLRN